MAQPQKKTDAQIQDDVLRELRWDTRVVETDVGVEVDDGIVTLTGTVDSWPARLAAQAAAHRVSGVLDVANDIHVKLPSSSERTDTDIARSVRAALESDLQVPHEHIMTTVSDGVVTLEGNVDYWSEHDDAERAVRNLPGVREVRNLITVEPRAARVAPEAIRQAINRAFERHTSHAANHVQIAIAEGTVILTGTVSSWPEHDAVLGAVRGTRGVQKIDDEITIGPDSVRSQHRSA
jgi:osmotically-inducible protein OsmY